ncbi:MAG: nitroreductase [Ruminococcaceae bacterium]|nr:nitroreductase [Oscillospiraceae bacterium]
MTLNEMIYKRKSCRSFTGIPVDEATIENIKAFSMKPLYPEIKVHWDIVSRNQVKCICPWTTPQLITIYSEETDGWLENVGFLFQQMDLYLQSIGLGVCWLGMGRMNPKTVHKTEGMQFVIMMAFGHPKGDQLRYELKGFKRRTPEQIADQVDPGLEPARLAPSAVNSQPWYFTHEGDNIHVYCSKKGNRLDAGIALAHLYVANGETFRFFKAENSPTVLGYIYIGSVML